MIKSKIQLRWSDFDMLGHVYNGTYQQLYDLGKSDFFDIVLSVKPDWTSGEGFVTASITTNFTTPIEADNKVEVITMVEAIGNKSFTFSQRIVDCDSSAVYSDSQAVMVCYEFQSKSTFVIPQKWRERLEQHLVTP